MQKDEMKQMQRKIAEKAVFADQNELERPEDLTVVGVDQAFTEDRCVTAAVVMEDGETVEEAYADVELEIPYIPGLLAFREGRSIVEALKKLESDIDLMILDGSGRVHFRQAGIATHIGVIFDKPSIGVAKNLLCGQTGWNGEKLSKDEHKPIKPDSKLERVEDEVLGYLYQSKQYSGDRKVNPLYISPGHRISADKSVEMVANYIDGYKLPEPVKIADSKVAEFKDNL